MDDPKITPKSRAFIWIFSRNLDRSIQPKRQLIPTTIDSKAIAHFTITVALKTFSELNFWINYISF